MSLDAVPSGFSSAAAGALLKTMRATQSANSSFIAEPTTSPFEALSKSTVSGDTIFSIIAAASKNQTATSASTQQGNRQSDQADIDRAEDLEHNDPYFQKNYTIDEAAQNYYAYENQTADALRRTGLTQDGQTNGQIIADLLKMQGQKGADFADAFDNKTLKVIDPTTLGLDATCTRSYLKSGEGIIGESVTMSINDNAWASYQKQNPNTLWVDDQGFKGGGGLMFSW